MQTEGQQGHTFWSAAVAGLTVLEEGLDILDQATNPFYTTEVADGTVPLDQLIPTPQSKEEQPTAPEHDNPTEDEDGGVDYELLLVAN